VRKAPSRARSLHLHCGPKQAREGDCEYACTLLSAPGAGYRYHHECDAFPLPERMLLWSHRAASARVVRVVRASPSGRSSYHDTRRAVRSPGRSAQCDQHSELAHRPRGLLEHSAQSWYRHDDTPPRAGDSSERSCSQTRTTTAASCALRRRLACRRVDRGSRCSDSSELVRSSSQC
jgi:hypothetical protein